LLSLIDPFPTGSHGGTNLRSGGELQTVYPTEWVVDLPLLRKEVTDLLIHTKSLRESESFRELAKNQRTPVKITVPKKKKTQPTPQLPVTPDQVIPVQPPVQPALGSPSHLPESVTPAAASAPTSPQAPIARRASNFFLQKPIPFTIPAVAGNEPSLDVPSVFAPLDHSISPPLQETQSGQSTVDPSELSDGEVGKLFDTSRNYRQRHRLRIALTDHAISKASDTSDSANGSTIASETPT
jgi:hypothetical protein